MTALSFDSITLPDAESPASVARPPRSSRSSRTSPPSRRRERSFIVAFAASVLVHAGLFACAWYFGLRFVPPSIALQAGSGGDGIAPGIAPGPLVVAVDRMPAPILSALPALASISTIDAPPTDDRADILPNVASALSADALAPTEVPRELLLSATDTDGWIGPLASSKTSERAMPAFLASSRNNDAQPTGRDDSASSTGAGGSLAHAEQRELGDGKLGGAKLGGGKLGDGGLGGDGFTGGMPTPAARNKPPLYPPDARRLGQEGTVTLEVEVLASGRVGTIEVLNSSGHESLDSAATQAVRAWLFQPATSAGQAQACRIRVPIRFVLRD